MADIAVITAALDPDPGFLIDAYESLCVQDADWRWLLQLDGAGAQPWSLPRPIASDRRVSAAGNGIRMGAAISRVNALARLEGEAFVQNLDADDRLLPGTLAALSCALAAQPDAAYAFGRELTAHPDGSETRYDGMFSPGVIPAGAVVAGWRERQGPPIHPAGVLWRAQALIAYGGWSALWSGQDTAVLVAASVHHPAVFVDHDTLWYRWHSGGQLSRSDAAKAYAQTKLRFIEMRAQALEAGGPAWRP